MSLPLARNTWEASLGYFSFTGYGSSFSIPFKDKSFESLGCNNVSHAVLYSSADSVFNSSAPLNELSLSRNASNAFNLGNSYREYPNKVLSVSVGMWSKNINNIRADVRDMCQALSQGAQVVRWSQDLLYHDMRLADAPNISWNESQTFAQIDFELVSSYPFAVDGRVLDKSPRNRADFSEFGMNYELPIMSTVPYVPVKEGVWNIVNGFISITQTIGVTAYDSSLKQTYVATIKKRNIANGYRSILLGGSLAVKVYSASDGRNSGYTPSLWQVGSPVVQPINIANGNLMFTGPSFQWLCRVYF